MIDVKFKEVSPDDSNEYIFVDKKGGEYLLYSDSRSCETTGVSSNFWDKFYFCEKININYKTETNKRLITGINHFN